MNRITSRRRSAPRVRRTFFIVLALLIGLAVGALLLNWLARALLMQIFIACSIFGIGVVLLDFIGLLGDGEGDGDVGFDMDGSDGGADFDASDFDGDADGDFDGDSGDSGGDALGGGGMAVLSALRYLRLFVYYCLGFGPTGLAAMILGRSALASLLFAVPAGLLSLLLASAFFRFQRSNTDSSLRPHDMLNERAVVTIPLSQSDMGRVRVQIGMNVSEPYALAADGGRAFEKGEVVQIVRVTDEAVYVA